MARALRLSALLIASAAAYAEDAFKPSKNFLSLQNATLSSSSAVVRLTEKNYTRFALDAPRDYDLLVLFTASEAKYGCAICGAVAKEMRIAAKSVVSASDVWPHAGVFFAVADFKNCQSAFAIHGFQSVPQIAVFPRTPPGTKASTVSSSEQVAIPRERLLHATEGTIDAKEIIALVPDIVNRVPVQRPAEERLPWAVLAVVVAAVWGSLIAVDKSNATFFLRPWFWRLACLCVFAVSVSGAISCVIKSSPWYGNKPTGGVVLFSNGGHHDQYVLEGAVIGALNLLAAGGVIALVHAARSRSLSNFGKAVLGIFAIAIFVSAYLRIVGYYQDKTRWYKLDALLPQHSRDLLRLWVWMPATKYWGQYVQPWVQGLLAHPIVDEVITSVRASVLSLGS